MEADVRWCSDRVGELVRVETARARWVRDRSN